MMLGTNLNRVSYFSPEYPFADLYKTSNGFINGMAQMEKPEGRVTITWDGDGTIKTPGGVNAASPIIYDSPRERLKLTKTGDVSNVQARIAEGLFNPAFLDYTKNYKCLRFMNWGRVEAEAGDVRPLPTDEIYTGINGVPLEIQIELCNTQNADMWITTHALWNDETNRQAAALVAEKLKPTLKVYVEHSNEVWNGAQKASQYTDAAADAAGLKVYEYHALRTYQIGEIWREELGSRAIVTLGAQAARLLSVSDPMNYLVNKFGAHKVNAIAVAPYVGLQTNVSNAAKYKAMPIPDIFEELNAKIQPGKLDKCDLTAHMALAKSYGCRLIAYEGGQHLVAKGDARHDLELLEKLYAVNRDPLMKPMYLSMLNVWDKATDGELFCHYLDASGESEYGTWGSVLYTGQPRSEAPKYDGLQTFIENEEPPEEPPGDPGDRRSGVVDRRERRIRERRLNGTR